HPLVRYWRRFGPRLSYTVVCTLLGAIMIGMVLLSPRLLEVDWGFRPLLAGIGIVCLVGSGWLLRQLRKQLPVRVLIGIPELAPQREPGELRTEGVYARVRHPRYLQMDLALLGYALVANYPAAYAAWLFWLAGIRLVVVLEERELHDRFGPAYAEYCRRTPRFIPRWPGKS
ncbi:MAG TPA: isoprenylcysteine carboxylmethyltransferase family protein, partial [Geobacteraceae bacterium]